MATLLIVDDDVQIVALVQRLLSSEGHTLLVAACAQEAIELLRDQRPDLLVLDINLPDMSGIEVCKYVRTHPPLAALRILFLTERAEIADRIVGLEAGADDYLSKPFFARELLYRVRALLRGHSDARDESALVSGPIRVDAAENRALVNGVPIELTPMQTNLLCFLMAHSGEVISTPRLLEQLWGYPPGSGSGSLVRMHILNLRSKIEADPRNPKLLRTIPKHGYMFAPNDPPSLPARRITERRP